MDVKKLRKQSGLLQATYWAKYGVTQSGGCRYENGRRLPKPLRMLLAMAHSTDAQAKRLLAELRAR